MSVLKGKWIPDHDEDAAYYEVADWIVCSECHCIALFGRLSDKPVLSDFCPHCGADMRQEKGE